jgi:hypothetical protein
MRMEAGQYFMPVNTATAVYSHRQKAGRCLYVTGFFTLFSIALFCFCLVMIKSSHAVFPLCIFAIVIVVFIWSTLSISSLTVTIDNEYIRLVFGPHAMVKKFALKDITSCKPVKNDFWDGWGIHMCGSGWLYNIAGFDAVEIALVSGRQNRIGTDEPQQLAEAIQNIITKFSTGGI